MSQSKLQRRAPVLRSSSANGLHPRHEGRCEPEITAMMSKKRILAIGVSVGVATFGVGALNGAALAQSGPPSNSSSSYDSFHNATPPVATDENRDNRGAQARERNHRDTRANRAERRTPRREYGRADNERSDSDDNGNGADQNEAWRSGEAGWNNGWGWNNGGWNNGWNTGWNSGYGAYAADPYWGGNANWGEYEWGEHGGPRYGYGPSYGYAPSYGYGYAPY
jgi:hypothetical protein